MPEYQDRQVKEHQLTLTLLLSKREAGVRARPYNTQGGLHMTRQQKYPDTHCFHFHNENPHGRFTSDCVVRAIARATGDDYNLVLQCLVDIQMDTGYGYTENRVIDQYLTGRGFTKHKQPRSKDGTKFTGDEFCLLFNPKRAVANIGGNHTVAIIDGKINDTWDSSGGCIGIYWTK